jgi:5'-nucleotidase
VIDETEASNPETPSLERRQLSLPLPGLIERPSIGLSIPQIDRVFANRNLRMGRIEWVGFDMDYTLAIYRQDEMDALSVSLTTERLIARGYPEFLRDLNFDTRFGVRGLLVDKKRGNILKMDRHQVVNQGFHGTTPLELDELHRLYGQEKLHPASKRFHWIDTLFALCEVTSYAAIISSLESRGQSVDFSQLFIDVRSAIDEAHADGTVYRHVTSDLARFIDRDAALPETLHKLRSAGKRLFVLTNSPYHFTDTVLSYLLTGEPGRYESYTQCFDAVVCSAKKPRWFQPQEDSLATPFLRRGSSIARTEPATEQWSGSLERGVVYEGGCLALFEEGLGIAGSSVLYVGDHIYGDILRSKKDSTWRTALVIQELDQEIGALQRNLAARARRRQLAEARPFYEDDLRFYGAKFKEVARSKVTTPDDRLKKERVKKHIEHARKQLATLEAEYEQLQLDVDRSFHPYWGSLLKEMNGLSIFGQQVSQYADIYMRRVSNLGAYSPTQFYRSPHDLMPHEI